VNLGQDTLALGDLAGPLGLLVVLIAGSLALSAILRPRWLWPLLVVGAIVGSGPKLKGYVIFDELFLIALVGGALMAAAVGALGQRDRPLNSTHAAAFIAWALFMGAQSLRGMVFERDPRIVRWTVMYLALAVLAHLLSRYRLRRPVDWHLLVVASTVALYAAYLVVGWYYERTLGPGGRYGAQGLIWAGTAAAVFPTAIAYPAALLLLERKALATRVLALAAMLIMGVVAWYYDSRFSWLMIGIFTILWLTRRPWVFVIAVTASLFLGIDSSVTREDADDYFSDSTRGLQLQIAADAASHDWVVATIGAGIYSHRTILLPYARAVFNRAVSDEMMSSWRDYDGQPMQRGFEGVYRTNGLPAFFIDTGLVGLGLFAVLFAMRAVAIMRSRTSTRRLWLATLAFAAFALVLVNPIDLILFYLLLLPNGPLDELAAIEPASNRRLIQPLAA
jgi:hypothetical protein